MNWEWMGGWQRHSSAGNECVYIYKMYNFDTDLTDTLVVFKLLTSFQVSIFS